MLDVKDERILQFVQDYKLNLIEPSKMSNEQLETFRTDLGLALKFIKYSKDKKELDELVSKDSRYRSLERDAFDLMSDITDAKIKPIMRGDKVDMCAAIEAMKMESRTEGEQIGIDKANVRVATDMLRKNLPLTLITEISKLSEDMVRGIANSIGVSIKLS